MSAQDNLSSELFFTVHRGITQSPRKNTPYDGLGMHWSLDPKIAQQRAQQWPKAGIHGVEGHPTTITADVPISSMEMDKKNLEYAGVYTEPEDFNIEKEVSVKKGAPVRVKEITQYKPNRTRTRRFNPPRQMKA